MRLQLLISLLLLSSAYVILPGMHKYTNQPAFGIRWNSPTKRDTWPKSTVDDGLAGGLTFAYSPSFDAFCEGLIGQMNENSMMIKWANCEEVENAVMRAMATWEANHQAIKFVDVTQACEREQGSTLLSKCSLAEILITSGPPATAGSTVAALVTHHSAEWGFPSKVGPWSTAGQQAINDYTIEKTSMHFNNHICWYLDNTFCGGLHASNASGFDVQICAGVILISFWIVGMLMLFKDLVEAGFRIKRQIRRRNMRTGAAVQETLLHVSQSLSHNKFVFLLIIISPVVFFDVIQLCFECYDFEAVVAHELGHVLGFGHADEYFMDNLMRPEGALMNNDTCHFAALQIPAFMQNPGSTVLGISSLTTDYTADCTGDSDGEVKCVPVSLDGSVTNFCCRKAAFDRVPLDSIMYSLTTHRARPCLSVDDLDGLNHLYPSCEHARVEDPICIKSSRNIGYARIALNVLIPFTLISVLSQALFRWSFRHNSRKLLRNKWKLAGKFVATEDAAAICMQAHFRKHSAMVHSFKKEVYAIVLQSAFRGAISRRQLVESRPSFGTVALAAHRDAQLQNASSHLKTANVHQAQLAELRARRVSTMPVTLVGKGHTAPGDLHVLGRISVRDPSRQSSV